ncbi:FGGY-family carbohydrate kinase [Agromyces ramosus]|uniref:Xylulokinase n=1 Tax=Agromyces ramosus TaxID=33879 RepID=A0ABU0R821_9MICO|nr:FGGY-family carbohydrate kinase [Agromyces ramosus]MDQ0893922.1 xylulokinase [Agromyces ramosus]
MGERCVLGVDIGTSSSKGVLVAEDGTILASAVREHRVERPHPGWVEMSGATWWAEFCSIATELIGGAASGTRIQAVGVSGMGPCVLLADDEGMPIRPAILYGVDSRAGEQVDRLEAEFGVDEIVRVGGSGLSSQAAGPKIAWIADHEPDAYARARRLFMPASWLAHRLTDEYVLDRHSASQCTPLFDIEAGGWHEPWWNAVAPGIEAPPLAWPGDVAGTVTASAALATGLVEGTPVIVGTIDAWSEAVSVGAVGPGDLMLMYGTTMFLVATVPEILRTPSMWTTTGAFRGTHSLAGGMATSGAITSWLRDLTNADYPELLAEADASGPGARGLVMLPYFAGERTPLLDPDARGVIAGLTLSHSRGDLYRAALEATAFGVRHNVETMRGAGARIDRIIAVGGGTQGSLWTQIVSDVTGLEQQLARTSVGASYGAAFLAASAIAGDRAPDIADWNPITHTVRPDPSTAHAYERGYRIYRELYPATADVAHRLARIQLEVAA